MIPAQEVKPYVKTNKSAFIDAEAIAEAVGRPTMRFVRLKADDGLDMQSVHRVRKRWVIRRAAVVAWHFGDGQTRPDEEHGGGGDRSAMRHVRSNQVGRPWHGSSDTLRRGRRSSPSFQSANSTIAAQISSGAFS